MARIHFVVKYTFFVIIALGAGFAIERLITIKHWKKSDARTQKDLIYNASSLLTHENFETVLKKHYLKCLTNPSKPFCLLSANKRLELFQSDQADVPNAEVIESRLKNINSDLHPRRLRMHSMLVDFTRFMKTYDIKVLLIEPSILFCLLSSDKKYDMLTRRFNLSRLQGSRNVVTVGVLGEDSKKLEEGNLTREIVSAGFKIVKFRKWMVTESEKSFEAVHYFFILKDMVLHVVILYSQNTYLWHASLDTQGVDFDGLLYVDEGLFENFTLLPLNLEGSSISRMFLPHDILYFMQQIETSRSVKCKSNFSIIPFLQHPSLTIEQLNTRTVIALKELKAILAPQIVIFWLWSKTLLGWFATCDVFHYSTTLELALTHKSIRELEFSELLAGSAFLKVANTSESDSGFGYKLNCHGLDINIFILHEDKNLLWLRRNEGLNTLNLTYPVFTLCSTNVFGQKVHVPCNTDEILKLEYDKTREDVDTVFTSFTR